MIGCAYFRPATTAETNFCFCVCRSICFIDCGQDVKNFLKNILKTLPKYITHPVFNYGYHPWHMNIMTWTSHKCWKPDVFFLVLFFFCPQSASSDMQTVSWLQKWGQSVAFCDRFKLLASGSTSSTAYTSSTQTSNWGGVCKAHRGAAFNILWYPLRWLWMEIRYQ